MKSQQHFCKNAALHTAAPKMSTFFGGSDFAGQDFCVPSTISLGRGGEDKPFGVVWSLGVVSGLGFGNLWPSRCCVMRRSEISERRVGVTEHASATSSTKTGGAAAVLKMALWSTRDGVV
jgi:hypothetical protein